MICIDANMSARLFAAFKVQSHKVCIKPIVMKNLTLGQQPTYQHIALQRKQTTHAVCNNSHSHQELL